jgi:hypothetical protein
LQASNLANKISARFRPSFIFVKEQKNSLLMPLSFRALNVIGLSTFFRQSSSSLAALSKLLYADPLMNKTSQINQQ